MIIDDSIFDISKELFPAFSSNFSRLEENDNFDDVLSSELFLVNPSEKFEEKEIIFSQEYNNNKLKNKETIINIKETNNIKCFFRISNSKEKNCERNAIKEFLRSVRNMENIIIKDLGYKNNISLGKLNYFLKNNSLEEIKHKTLKEIFGAISPKNIFIINYFNDVERKKGKTIFGELNKLTFEEMYDYYIQDCKCIISGIHLYNLSGKFKTLKDVSKKKNKKLKKNHIKKRKKKHNDKVIKKLEEIEQEVCAVIID